MNSSTAGQPTLHCPFLGSHDIQPIFNEEHPREQTSSCHGSSNQRGWSVTGRLTLGPAAIGGRANSHTSSAPWQLWESGLAGALLSLPNGAHCPIAPRLTTSLWSRPRTLCWPNLILGTDSCAEPRCPRREASSIEAAADFASYLLIFQLPETLFFINL